MVSHTGSMLRIMAGILSSGRIIFSFGLHELPVNKDFPNLSLIVEYYELELHQTSLPRDFDIKF